MYEKWQATVSALAEWLMVILLPSGMVAMHV